MRLNILKKRSARQLSRRVLSVALSATLAVNSLLVGAPIFNTAEAVVDSIHPSTNAINKVNGWAHINLTHHTTTDVTLEFISTRGFISCFEYRTNGNTSQAL